MDLGIVKVMMLKGEKGDTGAGGIWGNIEGDINDQEDLQAVFTTLQNEIYTKVDKTDVISTSEIDEITYIEPDSDIEDGTEG